MVWSLKNEIVRKILHIIFVVIILLVYQYLQGVYTPKYALAIIVLILIGFIVLEYFRIEHKLKVPLFNSVWRENEKDRLGGEMFLLISIIISLSIFGLGIVIPALIISTCGDITASIIGQKYSRNWVSFLKTKSYEAILAQLAVCLVLGVFILESFWIALAVALVVTILETATSKVSDNLVVPLAASLTLYFFRTFFS